MVEGTGFENRQGRKLFGGSNPLASAEISMLIKEKRGPGRGRVLRVHLLQSEDARHYHMHTDSFDGEGFGRLLPTILPVEADGSCTRVAPQQRDASVLELGPDQLYSRRIEDV